MTTWMYARTCSWGEHPAGSFLCCSVKAAGDSPAAPYSCEARLSCTTARLRLYALAKAEQVLVLMVKRDFLCDVQRCDVQRSDPVASELLSVVRSVDREIPPDDARSLSMSLKPVRRTFCTHL